MRGKIIQYNGADGTGTIVAEGRQYRFALATWHGNSAPAVNKTVEIALDGENVTAVAMVGEDVLIKEKAAELGGKLGAMFNKASASVSQARAANGDTAADAAPEDMAALSGAAAASGVVQAPGAVSMQSIVERYGKLLLAAYVLFVLGTLAFNAISVTVGPGMGKSLFDIASLMSQWGSSGGGMIKVLLLAGYASIVLPHFWRDRRAWLTLALPLLAVVWAVFSALHSLRSVGGAAGDEVSSMVRNEMSQLISIDFGFYLSLIAALALAVLGVKRFLGAA